jgi:hypothetical protein
MRFVIKIPILLIILAVLLGCLPEQKRDSLMAEESGMLDTGINGRWVLNPAYTASPIKDSGIVDGVILSRVTKTPLSFLKVYLGNKLPMKTGPEYLITFTQNGSPQGTTNADGFFEIIGVPPGVYPLILWTPFETYIVTSKSEPKELMVKVEKGQITSLGIIEVDWRMDKVLFESPGNKP